MSSVGDLDYYNFAALPFLSARIEKIVVGQKSQWLFVLVEGTMKKSLLRRAFRNMSIPNYPQICDKFNPVEKSKSCDFYSAPNKSKKVFPVNF